MPDETPTTFRQRVLAKLPTYWKIASIRCSIYAFIVGSSAFDAGVEGYDSFSQMTGMEIIKLVGHIIVAAAGVWVAFLDQTMTQMKNEKPTT